MTRETVKARRQSHVRSPGGPRQSSASARGVFQKPSPSTAKARRGALGIDVVWSDIKSVEADVLLVGHYLGVLPQTAELELDRLVSGRDDHSGHLIITELTRRGALRGDLGEVVLFPSPNGRVVALGGMGRLGTFRAAQLRVLAGSVAQAIGLLPARSVLATVLIGSGKGNLKVREAVTPFLDGLVEALDADRELKLDRVRFVEMHLDRALEIMAALKESAARLNQERKERSDLVLAPAPALVEGVGGRIPADFGCSMMLAALARATGESGSDVGGALRALLAELPEDLRETVGARLRQQGSADQPMQLRDIAMNFRLREPEDDNGNGDIPARVAFWRSDSDIRAAAITNSTTVTERARTRRAPIVDKACEKLHNPEPDKLRDHAASLCRLLVPPELKDVLIRTESLVIEVDRALARVQWETLPAGLNGEPLGVARHVARQLRTFYSPRPFEPGAKHGLKALVIGDPGGPDLVLLSAREEAVAVAQILTDRGVETRLLVGAPEDGTGAGVLKNIPPADYYEVIDLLLSGEFDIVHYSGHAIFDSAVPDRAGWRFMAGVLTAHELDGMERPPRLVVANACLSSQISQQAAAGYPEARARPNMTTRGDLGLVASLADEFFKQGVSDYIGAAWEIPSVPAKIFAEEFYDALLVPGGKIGPAVRQARTMLYKRQQELGAAWAAYQHYGDPTRSILPIAVQPENG